MRSQSTRLRQTTLTHTTCTTRRASSWVTTTRAAQHNTKSPKVEFVVVLLDFIFAAALAARLQRLRQLRLVAHTHALWHAAGPKRCVSTPPLQVCDCCLDCAHRGWLRGCLWSKAEAPIVVVLPTHAVPRHRCTRLPRLSTMATRVTFEKSRIIQFGSLSSKEKERYMDFLIDNNIQVRVGCLLVAVVVAVLCVCVCACVGCVCCCAVSLGFLVVPVCSMYVPCLPPMWYAQPSPVSPAFVILSCTSFSRRRTALSQPTFACAQPLLLTRMHTTMGLRPPQPAAVVAAVVATAAAAVGVVPLSGQQDRGLAGNAHLRCEPPHLRLPHQPPPSIIRRITSSGACGGCCVLSCVLRVVMSFLAHAELCGWCWLRMDGGLLQLSDFSTRHTPPQNKECRMAHAMGGGVVRRTVRT